MFAITWSLQMPYTAHPHPHQLNFFLKLFTEYSNMILSTPHPPKCKRHTPHPPSSRSPSPFTTTSPQNATNPPPLSSPPPQSPPSPPKHLPPHSFRHRNNVHHVPQLFHSQLRLTTHLPHSLHPSSPFRSATPQTTSPPHGRNGRQCILLPAALRDAYR